jgi:hypothetical protein
MRSSAAFAAFIALACLAAGLADAATKGRASLTAPARPAAARALRGPIDAAVSPPIKTAALRGLSPLPSPTPSAPDAEQCRLACAQSYYFCAADEGATSDCPESWSSCTAGCEPSAALYKTSPAT